MIEWDTVTLRAIAHELDEVADQTGNTGDEREAMLSGFVSGYAATLRTRALEAELNWRAPTRELPTVPAYCANCQCRIEHNGVQWTHVGEWKGPRCPGRGLGSATWRAGVSSRG